MCQCGCEAIIARGPAGLLREALAIVKELGITVDNTQLFEDGERICIHISSKLAGGDDDEVLTIADQVSAWHRHIYSDQRRACAAAARDVFAKMPSGDTPLKTLHRWHQLEQLCHHIGPDILASIGDSRVADTLTAVQHVHEDRERDADLLRQYHLRR